MGDVKSSTVPLVMWASLQALLRCLPLCLAVEAIDMVSDTATSIITNNRGPSEPLVFDGRRCSYWVSWAPTRASVGICITVYTYAATVRCSVSADSSCVPRPERLVEHFNVL